MARMGDMRFVCRVLVGRHEGKRALRRLGVGGRMILKLILSKWGSGDIALIDVTEDTDIFRALVNAEMNLRVP